MQRHRLDITCLRVNGKDLQTFVRNQLQNLIFNLLNVSRKILKESLTVLIIIVSYKVKIYPSMSFSRQFSRYYILY